MIFTAGGNGYPATAKKPRDSERRKSSLRLSRLIDPKSTCCLSDRWRLLSIDIHGGQMSRGYCGIKMIEEWIQRAHDAWANHLQAVNRVKGFEITNHLCHLSLLLTLGLRWMEIEAQIECLTWCPASPKLAPLSSWVFSNPRFTKAATKWQSNPSLRAICGWYHKHP